MPSDDAYDWTVVTFEDIKIILNEFGIETHELETSPASQGWTVIVGVYQEDFMMTESIVAQMVPPAGSRIVTGVLLRKTP